MIPSDADALAAVARLLPLFRELNHLKRIRVAGKTGSWAERLFVRSWSRLVGGEEVGQVAYEETARAVVATLLAGVDDAVLEAGGLPINTRKDIMRRAFDTAAVAVEPGFAACLRAHLSPAREGAGSNFPAFVAQLATQPRAGATRPGFPRVMLEPAENHAEHCAIVAINGVLAASCFGADPAMPFLTGLVHHLHNARLPDAGDAGDVLLGEHISTLMEVFRAAAIAELPAMLQEPTRAGLEAVYRADDPASKSFQAADSLDRVLEMEWHARSAAFTLNVALGEMDIIHPGPVQAFQMGVMRAVGWKP